MNLPVKVTQTFGRVGLTLKKHSPDILFGLGIAGVIGSTVLIAKAARKHDETKEQVELYLEDEVGNANNAAAAGNFTDVEFKQAVGKAYISASLEWFKLYGPGVSLMTASIAALALGHHQSKERMASAVAAYALIERSYSQYRKRVIEKLGEESDVEFRMGPGEERSIEVVEDGKKKKLKYTVHRDASDYTAFFDEYSLMYRNEAPMNMWFLKSQQAHLNDLLNIRGHVFLNEVWDCLGIPRTKAGAIVGWVKNGEGDGVIDLGIYSTANQAFVNGYEAACLIDPNVDGVIYDKLF